jgi:hypothetical protein
MIVNSNGALSRPTQNKNSNFYEDSLREPRVGQPARSALGFTPAAERAAFPVPAADGPL